MERIYSKLDPIQIQKKVYDEESESNRVKMVDTEMAIEVSAEDGDSVIAVPMSESLAEGIHSVIGMKTLCVYGTATVEISPLDEGELFYTLETTMLQPKAICARRIKIAGTGLVVVQSV